MKKIMFFRPHFSMGGTEIAMLNLIRRLKGYEIYVSYTNESSDQELLSRFKPYAKIVNLNNIENIEVDTLISCSAHYNLEPNIKKVSTKQTILWIHHLINIETTMLKDIEETKSLDYIVTVSNTTANKLKELFPHIKEKIKSIYNVINGEDIIKASNEPINLELSKELNLVTVARVCYDKGFKRMLVLANLLKEKNIDFKWFIVGGNFNNDEYEEIKDSFKDFKDNFKFFGFIENPHNIVKQCDYTVLLSSGETWGLALTEAMILNVPCISSDFEVAFEQITDKVNGIILSRENTDSYKTRIEDIITNKDKYKKAVKNYTYDNTTIIENWNNIINN